MIVDIARIELRRGKRNTIAGFPQLASGELGWAIDTQELFIGNGSVSEGAPSAGNTRILTVRDAVNGTNIFDIVIQTSNGVTGMRINSVTPLIGYATQSPTTGTWSRGDRLFNSEPASGQPTGWICTVSGSPGTWSVEHVLP